VFCFRLPGKPARAAAARAPLTIRELLVGARFVWRSELRPVWPLIAGVGLFFSGAYNVLFPVMVRDVYQGGVDEIGILLFAFPAGTIFASGFLFFRGIRRKGRALAISQILGALTVIGCGLGAPFWAVVAFTFVWGLAGGPPAARSSKNARRSRSARASWRRISSRWWPRAPSAHYCRVPSAMRSDRSGGPSHSADSCSRSSAPCSRARTCGRWSEACSDPNP
jgi:hypothetical protein